MAEDIPFISEEDLEAILGTTVPTDLALTIALDSACDTVRSYIGQRVNFVEDDIIYLDGTGRDAIRLPERPVRAVTEIQEDGVVLAAGTYPDHEWMLRAKSGIVVRQSAYWRSGRRNIKVTYDHGWNVTAPLDMVVPADLRMATLSCARRIIKSVGDTMVPQALTSETIGDYSYTLADLPEDVQKAVSSAGSLTDGEKNLLAPFRVLGVASGSKN
jgi:hypothetical protein